MAESDATSSSQMGGRQHGRTSRRRIFGAITLVAVTAGLLTTLLYVLSGSHRATSTRANHATELPLAGDCTQVLKPAPTQASWPQFGFGASGGRCNPYEMKLSPTNVHLLKLAWDAPGVFMDSSPVIDAGRVFASAMYPDSNVSAFDANTGKRIWSVKLDIPAGVYTDTPTVADGIVVVGSQKDLLAFDEITGKSVWKFTAPNFIRNTPVIAGGVVYDASFDHHVYAIDLHTGKELWATTLDDGPLPGPVAVTDKFIFVSAVLLYALDRKTGAILRTMGVGDPLLYSEPVVSNGSAYVTDEKSHIDAFAVDSGELRFQSAPFTNEIGPLAGASHGHLFVGEAGGAFHMVDGSTGRIQWSVKLPYETDGIALPAIANGVVYVAGACDCVAGSAHFIVALQETNGKILWQYAFGSLIDYAPVVANGYLYISTSTGLSAFTV